MIKEFTNGIINKEFGFSMLSDMKRKTPETLMTNAVIELLQRAGYTVKKIYNGGTPARVDRQKGIIIYKKKNEEYKGIPDLIAYNLSKGRFYFIEVKKPDGKPKVEQKEFLNAFNSCTAYKGIVINDLITLKNELFSPWQKAEQFKLKKKSETNSQSDL